jgi:molybdopterin-biosynthesis enzyme MoeA-like protein
MGKVGIISIGDELVNGFTIDTNSSWIAKKIYQYDSIDIKEKINIKDDLDKILFLFQVVLALPMTI